MINERRYRTAAVMAPKFDGSATMNLAPKSVHTRYIIWITVTVETEVDSIFFETGGLFKLFYLRTTSISARLSLNSLT